MVEERQRLVVLVAWWSGRVGDVLERTGRRPCFFFPRGREREGVAAARVESSGGESSPGKTRGEGSDAPLFWALKRQEAWPGSGNRGGGAAQENLRDPSGILGFQRGPQSGTDRSSPRTGTCSWCIQSAGFRAARGLDEMQNGERRSRGSR
jgi:hypothetical protein